jgi:hypothetical protein
MSDLTQPKRPFSAMSVSDAVEAAMRQRRQSESPEERNERLNREAQMKISEAAANEAAIDRMIRRNIKKYGP